MRGKKQQMNRCCNRSKSAKNSFARIVAGITVFCAVFVLTIPVTALKSAESGSALDLTGKVLHTHNEFCRDSEGKLICPLPELEEHVHSETCYETAVQGHIHTDACYIMERGALICQESDQSGHVHTDACYQTTAAHEHEASCYTKVKGEQICALPEREGHSHGDACYEPGALTCTAEESEEHTHGTSCYDKILICGTQEESGHVHCDDCFAWEEYLSCSEESVEAAPESVLICTQTEQTVHVHGDACYEWTKVLTCSEEEYNAASTEPTEPEKTLVCSKIELKNHIHVAACYNLGRLGKGQLVCNQLQLEQHQHTNECLDFTDAELICKEESKEHQHHYLCYRTWSFLCQNEEKPDNRPKSDPNADVETPEIWEKTFEHVKLTGAWSHDLLAIAQTQLGYEESERNFAYQNGRRKGYTRYGEWYGGVEYGDWCAMFIAFCMHYAGVEGVPFSCSCERWVEFLESSGMYTAADSYTPRPGDLVFFDSSRTSETPETVPIASDHVGIAVEVIPATEEKPAAVVTIEGNYYDCVRYETRYLDDPRITGYCILPDGPAALYSCGLKAHSHGTACYDEAGKMVCQVKEHTHDTVCRSRRLRYADSSVSVDITLSNAIYLPADLYLRAALVTENEKSTCDAMIAAVEDVMPENWCSAENARFVRMQLFSGGKPCELPTGVQAEVHVAFEQPLFAAKSGLDTAERYTFLLIEEEPENFASVSYKAVELNSDSYKNTDDGIMSVEFTADQVSAFSVAVNTQDQTTILLDMISRIKQ